MEELINNRNLVRNSMSAKTKYKTFRQLLWQWCRGLKKKWWLITVTESQTLVDSNDLKYQSKRGVWESRVNHSEQLQFLYNKTIIWLKDNFATLLNELSTVEQHVVDNIE